MYVDLNPLLNKEAKWAVHCPTEELAELFVSAMRTEYPDYTVHWDTENRWDTYKENTTYFPDINKKGGYDRLTYAFLSYFENPANGYVVIPVESLLKSMDLPEFHPENESGLYSMFGIDMKA